MGEITGLEQSLGGENWRPLCEKLTDCKKDNHILMIMHHVSLSMMGLIFTKQASS